MLHVLRVFPLVLSLPSFSFLDPLIPSPMQGRALEFLKYERLHVFWSVFEGDALS